MNGNPNAIEIQKYLKGVDYPASKDTIISTAESNGADGALLDALRGIADKEYEGPTGVSEQLGGS